VQQTGLADAGLANNVDDTFPSVGFAKATLQDVQLSDAPDIGGEAAADSDVEPRRALSDALEPIEALPLNLALDLTLSDGRAVYEPIHQPMRSLAQQDLPRQCEGV
jgi:hypothetical protein